MLQDSICITANILQLYAVVCRLCAVGKLRIGAVITSRDYLAETLIEVINKKLKQKKRWQQQLETRNYFALTVAVILR